MSAEQRRQFAEEHDLDLPDCPDCGDPLVRYDGVWGVCSTCGQYVSARRVEA